MKRAHLDEQANFSNAQMRVSHKREHLNEKTLVEEPFFVQEAIDCMKQGIIPDLSPLKRELSKLNIKPGTQLSATEFLPALRSLSISKKDLRSFLSNPQTNHVLVQNDFIKIVLIRWEAGASCDIHGHAIGGCVFKVLQGEVEENRFMSDSKQKMVSKNTYFEDSIAYIDDQIGLHNVKNPTDKPAITLHLYTPGNYKPKKYLKVEK